MSTYESVGTVRFNTDDDGIQVLFVPDGDHEFKHESTSYAVFITEKGDSLIHKDIGADGVSISVVPKDWMSVAVAEAKDFKVADMAHMLSVISASLQQTKVKISVDESFKLTGIKVPAK